MSGNRIKGQEVDVLMMDNGQMVGSLTAIKSFDFKFQLELMSEGYLGERTERKDSIFKGVSCSMEVHHDDRQALALFVRIVEKAKRRVPGSTINIKATLNYPDGTRARIFIPDVEFGEIPVNFGSRSDYGTTSLDMEASEARTILS